MIGTCCDRSRCLISSASSKPSSSGIWTSSRMQANRRGAGSPSAPRRRTSTRHELVTERLEHRLAARAGSPRGRRRAGCSRTMLPALMRTSPQRPRRNGGISSSCRMASAAVAASAASGIARLSDVAGSWTIATPPRSLIARVRGAVGVRAREHDADAPFAVRVRCRVEQHVDRRPRISAPARRSRARDDRPRRARDSRAARGRRDRARAVSCRWVSDHAPCVVLRAALEREISGIDWHDAVRRRSAGVRRRAGRRVAGSTRRGLPKTSRSR